MDTQAALVYALILVFIAYALIYLLGKRTPARNRSFGVMLLAYGIGALAWPHMAAPWACITGALFVSAGLGFFHGNLTARPLAHVALAYGLMLVAWPEPLGGGAVALGALLTATGFVYAQAPAKKPAAHAAHSVHH